MKKMIILQTTILVLSSSPSWGQSSALGKSQAHQKGTGSTEVKSQLLPSRDQATERKVLDSKRRSESEYRINSHDLTILNRNIDSLPQEFATASTSVILKSARTKTKTDIYFDQRDNEGMLILYGKQDSLKKDQSGKLSLKNGYTDGESKLITVLNQKYHTTLLKKVVTVSESIKSFSFAIKIKSTAPHKDTSPLPASTWSSSFTIDLKSYTFRDLEGNEVKGGEFLSFEFEPEMSLRQRNKIKDLVLNQIERRRLNSDIYSLAVESLGLTLPL